LRFVIFLTIEFLNRICSRKVSIINLSKSKHVKIFSEWVIPLILFTVKVLTIMKEILAKGRNLIVRILMIRSFLVLISGHGPSSGRTDEFLVFFLDFLGVDFNRLVVFQRVKVQIIICLFVAWLGVILYRKLFNDRNISVQTSIRILIFFVKVVSESTNLTIISIQFLLDSSAVIIGTEILLVCFAIWLSLNHAYVFIGLLIVNHLGFWYSELHFDDVFLDVSSRLEHFDLELV